MKIGGRSGKIPRVGKGDFARPRRRGGGARAIAVLGLGVTLLASAGTRAGKDDLGLLRERVRRMIELRKTAHEAELRWQEQHAELRREEEILAKQREKRKQQLDDLQQQVAAGKKELAGHQAALQQRRDTVRAMAAGVVAGERALRRLRAQLPPCLAGTLAPAFAELDAGAGAEDPAALALRLQRVFSLLSEIENFANGVHVCRQALRLADGSEREMDVLYLGLGGAYAVSSGGRVAGVGLPGGDGWRWQWDAALAGPIRRAIAIYRKERPAGFVDLPVVVAGGRKEP